MALRYFPLTYVGTQRRHTLVPELGKLHDFSVGQD